jgi:hypothetical protein
MFFLKSFYDKLYNWCAVNDVRGLITFRLPWTSLETCLGGSSVAEGAMKEIGTTHWLKYDTDHFKKPFKSTTRNLT